MKIKQLKLAKILWIALAAVAFTGCKYETSSGTGWDYNNRDNGGFQKVPFEEQETGPGLVLIEGGTFTMGRVEQDVTYDWNTIPRRVTVSSFYLDQLEVSNFNYLEYLYWIRRTFTSYPTVYKNALPDTLVWREKLAYMEPYVEYYLRHPAYRDYPVVGVSWLQANDYCKWRTDRVNEFILIREGVLQWYPAQSDDDVFNTDSYLAGQYDNEQVVQKLPDLDPNNAGTGNRGRKSLGERIVRMEDGILLPRYRLPTEAEWEYASYGLIGNTYDERIVERRIYPWNGHWVRNPEDKFQGEILANFVRGRGDYMGVAGKLNDNADVTAPVQSYWPNDYGLYNMAGNVSEWVMDVYRPLSHEDFDEFRPFRGNKFKTKVLNSEGQIEEKGTTPMYDYYGMFEFLYDFRKVREEGTWLTVSDRQRISEDSLIFEIQSYVARAIEYDKNGDDESASGELLEVFDNVLTAYDDSFPDYHKEIPGMLRQGLSDYVLHGEQENGASLPGSLRWREVTAEENLQRTNYTISDNINYKDGDLESSHYYEARGTARGTMVGGNYNQQYNQSAEDGTGGVIARINNEKFSYNTDTTFNTDTSGAVISTPDNPLGIASLKYKYTNGAHGFKKFEKNVMYQSMWDQENTGLVGQPTTLVSDRSRVYKGASWRDRAYWMNGGTRRFLDEDKSKATIGFRCAMTRVGSPAGLGTKRKRK